MKFSAEASTFSDRVAIAAEAAAKPVYAYLGLSGLSIDADEKKQEVVLKCAGQDSSASVAVPAEVAESGTVTVPAVLLKAVARAASVAETVTLALSGSEQKSCIVSDSDLGEWTIKSMERSDLVDRDIDEKQVAAAEIDHATMRDVERVVAPCAASEDDLSRPVLCGIETVVRSDGTVVFTATDTYRLGSIDTAKTKAKRKASKAIIPPRSLLSAARHVPKDSVVSLVIYKSWATIIFCFEDGAETHLSVGLIAGDYPDWSPLVTGTDRPNSLRVAPAAAINAINRTQMMQEAKSSPFIKLEIDTSELTFESRNAELGVARDVVPCEASERAAGRTAHFTVPYLREAIQHCPDETVSIMFDDEGDDKESPWLAEFECASGASATTLVMPSRTQ